MTFSESFTEVRIWAEIKRRLSCRRN